MLIYIKPYFKREALVQNGTVPYKTLLMKHMNVMAQTSQKDLQFSISCFELLTPIRKVPPSMLVHMNLWIVSKRCTQHNFRTKPWFSATD